jgi:translocation and assembly module TamB
MARWLRIAALLSGGLILLLIFAAGAGYGWLQTQSGRHWVAAKLSSASDGQIQVVDLSGALPFHVHARQLILSDAAGSWLTADNVQVSIRPAALLRFELEVEVAHADHIELTRLPQQPDKAKGGPGLPSVPKLPVSIQVQRLSAPEIAIAQTVLGKEARLSVSGSGGLHKGSAQVALSIQRLDAPGRARANVSFDDERLMLDADLTDPTGLVGRMLGADKDVPVALHASGDGPLLNWRGTLEATIADAVSRVDAAVNQNKWTLSGTLDPRPLLEARIATLLPEPLKLEASLGLGNSPVLQHIVVASGATRLSFDGNLRLDDMTGAGNAELGLPDAAVLEPLVGAGLRGKVSATATVEATSQGQSATLLIHGEGLGADRYQVHTLTLNATAQRPFGADAAQIQGTLQGSSLAQERAEGARVLAKDLSLAFDGSISPSGKIQAKHLALTADGAEANFVGLGSVRGFVDGTAQISLPEIQPLAQLAGLDWTGALSLQARLQGSPDTHRIQLNLNGDLQKPVTGIAALDAALGGSLSLSAVGSVDFAGAAEIARAELKGGNAELSLSGELAPAGPIDARFMLSATDLSVFAAALKQPVAGRAQITGSITGTTADPVLHIEATSPDLSVASTTLRDLTLTAELSDLVTPNGMVKGRARIFGLDTGIQTGLRLAQGVLTFSDADMRAGGTVIKGGIAITLNTADVTGNLAIDSPDLSAWSALAGMPLKGRVKATATLRPDGGAVAEATASALGIGNFNLAELRMNASLPRWRDQITGRINAEARQVTAGAVSFETATVRIEPKKGTFGINLTGSGFAGAPFTLNTQGTYEPEQRRLALAQLSGRYAEKPVSLRKSTSFSFGKDITVAPFDFAWGQTIVTGEIALGSKYSGRIRVNGLQVQDIGALVGRQNLQGTAQATLALSGTSANPNAQLNVQIAKFAFSDNAKQSPAGDLSMSGTLTRSGLDWHGELTSGTAGLSVAATGALPIAWSNPPFDVTTNTTGPLRAKIKGSGEFGLLMPLVGLAEDKASGAYAIDLTVAGTLAKPLILGSAKLDNGRYENFASGAVLTNLSLAANGANDQLNLQLTASDGEGGKVEAQGALHLSGLELAAIDLNAKLNDFQAIRRDDVRARATGALALAGPLSDMTLSGELRLDKTSIHLPERSRISATKLEVIEINGPSPGGEHVARGSAPLNDQQPALDIGLNVKAKLPDVEVEGRGLRSQWFGALTVTGSTAKPQVKGELRMRRGTFTLLGKDFTLIEGQIVFSGGPNIDPSLRVIAEKQVRDAVARATLTGSLSSPLLEFSARPDLPVDEVLARLLFDKSAGQVGAGEALQLAQAAAALGGGATSTGVLEDIGHKFGLDSVGVSTVTTGDQKSGTTAEAPALAVGKNVGENVRVGVEQGVQQGTGNATVEVDLGKRLSVESNVGAQGGGVGLKWRYDY